MGREARARHLAGAAPRGLPETPQLTERRMVKKELDAIRRTGKTPRVNFSDRAYLVDASGTVRRVPLALTPAAPAAPTMTLTEIPAIDT